MRWPRWIFESSSHLGEIGPPDKGYFLEEHSLLHVLPLLLKPQTIRDSGTASSLNVLSPLPIPRK